MNSSHTSTSPQPGSGGTNQRHPEPAQNSNDSSGNPVANSTTPRTAGSTNIPGVRTEATCVTKKPMPSVTDAASKRLLQELQQLQKNPVEGVAYVRPRDDNLFNWDVAFFGAPDTPYQGGYFKVRFSVC